MTRRILLLVALMLLPTLDARAGIFFNRNKKDKVDPKLRVPELITAVRADRDADKRARAAEELRTYDPLQFPDILPVLVEAALKDDNPSVRIEAIQGIGKIRPVSRQAGEALEHILANDRAMRVRLQARTTLMGYSWAGYRAGMKDATPVDPAAAKSPPVVNTTPPTKGQSTPIRMAPTPPTPTTTTKEPPLAPPTPAPPVASPAPPVKAESNGSGLPLPLPLPLPVTPPKSSGEGPDLP